MNHNVKLFRLNLGKRELGCPIGGHIKFFEFLTSAKNPEGSMVGRKYSPVQDVHQKGHTDIIVKIYRGDPANSIPPGVMSAHCD